MNARGTTATAGGASPPRRQSVRSFSRAPRPVLSLTSIRLNPSASKQLPQPTIKRGEAPGAGSWEPALLAAAEPGRRNRRTVDAVILLAAAIVIGLTAVVAPRRRKPTRAAHALTTLFGWANAIWRTVFVALLLLALVVVVDVFLRRRWSWHAT